MENSLHPARLRSPLAENSFDPFADLMVLQTARPSHWQPINLRTLSPFQRALVSIDGTVTKFIESYTLEPVEVMRLQQQEQTLQSDHHWLAAPAGSKVIARQVLLYGKYSATTYAYAVSLLLADHLSIEMMHGLDVEPAGLGRILLNSQLENRREVLYTGNDFISRTYRIIVGGQPLMLINEKFPNACPIEKTR